MPKEREHRRTWTHQEDEKLKQAVKQETSQGNKPEWKKVAQRYMNINPNMLPRNAKQCRQRWYNAVSQETKYNYIWGLEEDIKLIRACKEIGHRWSKLVGEFNHQINDNGLKNHFYSSLRKVVRHLNHFIKDQKKDFTEALKKNMEIPPQEFNFMREVNKLRIFDIKLISKVFSLMDSKQECRFEAKQTIQKEKVYYIHDRILDYMEDYLTKTNNFSALQKLELIANIMEINRSIKTKYIRESKMSLQTEEQLSKVNLEKKKAQKKLNNMVNEQLDNKLIPDKRTKCEVLEKLKSENKKVGKLLKNLNSCKKMSLNKNEHKDQASELEPQDFHQNQFGVLQQKEQHRQQNPIYEDQIDNSLNCHFESYRKNSSNFPQLQSSFQFCSLDKLNLSHQLELEAKKEPMLDEKQDILARPFRSTFLNHITLVQSSTNNKNKSTQTQGFFDFTKLNQQPAKFKEENNKNSGLLNSFFGFDKSPDIFFRDKGGFPFGGQTNQNNIQENMNSSLGYENLQNPFIQISQDFFNRLDMSRQIPFEIPNNQLLQSRGFNPPAAQNDLKYQSNDNLVFSGNMEERNPFLKPK